jgi:hypothetical protein
MPWTSDKLLVYDLTGKVLDPIPLPYRTSKAVLKVKGDRIGVVTIPFKGSIPSVAWVQKTDGTVLGEIPAGVFAVQPDYSNEIYSNQNIDALDVSFLFVDSRRDSLYHLDMEREILVPKFTADFGNRQEIHSYNEWPDYYVGTAALINGKIGASYIVDKKTGRGSYFRVVDDLFEGDAMAFPTFLFENGFYTRNIDPETLSEAIEKALTRPSLPDYLRKRFTEIQSSISPNDNNYIVYAKVISRYGN